MPWFAQKLGLELPVGLVVMGHTHVPKKGIACGVVDYLNTGFMCPSIPDINSGVKDITFAEIDINNFNSIKTTVYAVKNIVEGNQFYIYNYYRVDAIYPPKDYLLRPGEQDCSCYVSMFNAQDYIYYMSGGIAQYNVNMTLKEFLHSYT
ncbi:hypothetical protein [Romboutsia sp.]|uniref:hypothetical protein n=1 Tax=Romboutsia sp. TaxID=1965302 RepID=UPI003F2DD4BE